MVTRRAFLKAGGLAVFAAGWGGSPAFLARAARAAQPPTLGRRRKVLVTVFQRGAMDGLMAVTPFTDPMLSKMRPRLGMSAGRATGDTGLIDLDGRFGLHPALAPFKPLFAEKQLAIVHGVGSPDTTRSHFDAQDYMETGTPGRKGTTSGWLNRALGVMGHEGTPFRSVAMTSAVPRSLQGDEPALALARLEDLAVRTPGAPGLSQATGKDFEALYEQTSQQLLHDAGRESFEAIRLLKQVQVGKYVPANGVAYPASPLGNSLRQIAQLIKSDVGLEVAFAESNGWDTHVAEGTVNGTFARRAGDLAGAIAAFWADLGSRQDEVTLMTMTEFGRTVHENGSGGTDHGRGSCLFLLGHDVKGGKVHGTVPALDPAALEDGRDLPVTTDFRAVFASVAGSHLGIAANEDAAVFPGWAGKRASVMNA